VIGVVDDIGDAAIFLDGPWRREAALRAHDHRRGGSLLVLNPLKDVRIVSVFRVDTGRRCATSKNEEDGEKDAEDDDRNFSFT
jgi:hypothetical protein